MQTISLYNSRIKYLRCILCKIIYMNLTYYKSVFFLLQFKHAICDNHLQRTLLILEGGKTTHDQQWHTMMLAII